jgi:catechol 2,3-dioxygenase-like lactoylglutathione lyase family enzyme
MTEEALTPVLCVSNTDAAVEWYRRLGFAVDYEHSSGPSFNRTTVLLRRDELRLILSNREEDAHGTGLIVMRLSGVAAIAGEFGIEITETPVARHFELTDPDGNRLRIAEPRMERRA